MSKCLLAIDVQNDFCNPDGGALYVKGAEEDAKRLALFVDKMGAKLDSIHITLDSHNDVDIAHPIFWIDENGNHPAPFTIITNDDLFRWKWRTNKPEHLDRSVKYVDKLSKHSKYPLCIWPPHCIMGTHGWNLDPVFEGSISKWCKNNLRTANYHIKGMNVFTEHYSAFRAEVIDEKDPNTFFNAKLVAELMKANEIFVAGEARSHCVCNSIRDLIDEIGDQHAHNFILLEDTMSDVTGFEELGEKFVEDMKSKGMKSAKTTDF